MRITFKNVGQGDSIILEWEEQGDPQIGIIDCNLVSTIQHDRNKPETDLSESSGNPVLNHIRLLAPERIKFMLLTHPHKDHYSGFPELLDHCEQEGIKIEVFLQTAFFSARFHKGTSQPLKKYFERNPQIKLRHLPFIDLIRKIHDFRKKGIIKKIGFLTNDYKPFHSNSGIVIDWLSPSDTEMLQLMSLDHDTVNDSSTQVDNILLNAISAVTRIRASENIALLTADTTPEVLDRLTDALDIPTEFKRDKGVFQVPHHGADSCHAPAFWQQLRTGSENANDEVVFSCGHHGKHKHPARSVVNFFHHSDFHIHATNLVHSLESVQENYSDLDGDCVFDL